MARKYTAALVIAALITLLGVSFTAQTPEIPTLSETSQLQIRNLALSMEVAQLKARQAQADFDRAKSDLLKLVSGLQKDGYDLDLNTLQYKKKG